jgi:threonine aldolase
VDADYDISAMVDLRSDTVTLPPPEMLHAVAAAELGDDGYGEDPSANRLEEVAAARLGKEAAVLVASGTMGNLIGLLVNARPGDEVIADSLSHTFVSEAAGASMVAGVQIMPIVTEMGVLGADQVTAAMRPRHVNHPRTAAVLVENTHNRHGGVAWPLDRCREVFALARERGVGVHMDGARIFNAALAVGEDPAAIAAYADTVTFCLSKGLGCPAGSVLCGPHDSIEQARHWRKMLGGSMRQVGLLAAAGLYALDHMVDRLDQDHINARTLAEGLAEIDGVEIELARVQTNLVTFDLTSTTSAEFLPECAARGLKAGSPGGSRIRMVTHYGIGPAEIQAALGAIEEVLALHP